jgi:hypothetical protein
VPVFRCDAPVDHIEQVPAVPLELERVRGRPGMLASALAPHPQMEDELLFDSLCDEHRGALAAMYEEHQALDGMLHQAIECADTAERSQPVVVATRALARAADALAGRLGLV